MFLFILEEIYLVFLFILEESATKTNVCMHIHTYITSFNLSQQPTTTTETRSCMSRWPSSCTSSSSSQSTLSCLPVTWQELVLSVACRKQTMHPLLVEKYVFCCMFLSQILLLTLSLSPSLSLSSLFVPVDLLPATHSPTCHQL